MCWGVTLVKQQGGMTSDEGWGKDWDEAGCVKALKNIAMIELRTGEFNSVKKWKDWGEIPSKRE